MIVVIGFVVLAKNKLRHTDREIYSEFKEGGVEVAIKRIPFKNDSIRYVKTGVPIKEASHIFLGIHGAPGSSDAFYSYLKDATLRSDMGLISVDRPGYGYSLYGEAMTSIETQADGIYKVLENENANNVIIVSHSYGCPVGAVLAAKYPKRITKHVMLCPVIDPEHEKIFWYSHLPSTSLGKLIFSKSIIVSSIEKMTHIEELKEIKSFYPKTRVSTILYHGSKDWIAPVINAEYPKGKIADSILQVEILSDASHFIPWTRNDLVKRELLQVSKG